MSDQVCQLCKHPKSKHGPALQCPCIVYTENGSSITWNTCTFKGLSIAGDRVKDAELQLELASREMRAAEEANRDTGRRLARAVANYQTFFRKYESLKRLYDEAVDRLGPDMASGASAEGDSSKMEQR